MVVALALFAALAQLAVGREHAEALCPGRTSLKGYGHVDVVPTGWDNVSVRENGNVVTHMDGRAYFADKCQDGVYDHRDYLALNLLGKTLRYTVDLSGAGCGCNSALYLTSMKQNSNKSTCGDYYCDANSVCGVKCAEIDIQEANMYAWHSTLHTAEDRNGLGAGIGGGGAGWNGPRTWDESEYGPEGRCIDTSKPVDVAVSFPMDSEGVLRAMVVKLSQKGSPCPLELNLGGYKGMKDVSEALEAGMTPIVSYWNSGNMMWLDGEGMDHHGPCHKDRPNQCADELHFSNFAVEDYEPPQEEVVTDVEEPGPAFDGASVWQVPSATSAMPSPTWTPWMPPSTSTTPAWTPAPSGAPEASTPAPSGAPVAPSGAPVTPSPMSKLQAALFKHAPSVEVVNDICHSYISKIGCGWTWVNSCPGQKLGSGGLAQDDGSVGYKCCCAYEMWKENFYANVDVAISDSEEDDDTLPRLCAASYGTEVGETVCCGQEGFVNSKARICPKSAPTCIGYVHGRSSRWGTCQVAEEWQQCGGKRNGEDWWGPTSCMEGFVCSEFAHDYAQCVKKENAHYIMMKSALFRAFVPLVVEGRPAPMRLLAAVSLALVAAVAVARRSFRRHAYDGRDFRGHIQVELHEPVDV